MGNEEKEEVQIGKFVKLRKRDQELSAKISKLLNYNGAFHEAIKEKYGRGDDPERWFKAKMSVNPERVIELAEKLRSLQKEYEIAHRELREFEGKHPSIVEKYGKGQYAY